jgi:hypothetical protein
MVSLLATLAGVAKVGARTLRRWPIPGSSAVVFHASRRGAPSGSWLGGMLARKPRMLVVVVLANEMARIVRAVLMNEEHCSAPVAAAAQATADRRSPEGAKGAKEGVAAIGATERPLTIERSASYLQSIAGIRSCRRLWLRDRARSRLRTGSEPWTSTDSISTIRCN